MKTEDDGINSGVRHAGRGLGTLSLAAIPLALGAGFSVWLGAYMQAHAFFNLLSQEQRAAIYVAAPDGPVKPKEHIQIQVIKRECAKVERVDLDGDSIVVYGKNNCGHSIDYLAYHWQEISSGGVVIGQDYQNGCPKPTEVGDVAECRMKIPDPDDRAKTLRVWVAVEP
jgi:hypothetical protein